MENKFNEMKINNNNKVERWRQEKRLKSIKFCELKELHKGDYFIRLCSPKTLNIVTFATKPYMKYLDTNTYREEATTYTAQKVELVEICAEGVSL